MSDSDEKETPDSLKVTLADTQRRLQGFKSREQGIHEGLLKEGDFSAISSSGSSYLSLSPLINYHNTVKPPEIEMEDNNNDVFPKIQNLTKHGRKD